MATAGVWMHRIASSQVYQLIDVIRANPNLPIIASYKQVRSCMPVPVPWRVCLLVRPQKRCV